MEEHDPRNDEKVNIYIATKNLFEASKQLKNLNPTLSDQLLFTADSLLKTIEQQTTDPEIDKYCEFIGGKDWKIKQFEQDTLEMFQKEQKPFFGLELVATDLCNFQCKYCFENDYDKEPETMNDKLELVIKKIDDLLENGWFNSIFGGININFWGGEPTLNDELMSKICSYYKYNRKVKFHIFTNGYDLDSVKDIFVDMNKEGKLKGRMHKFTVQFSYDGFPIHDFTRVKGGKPTSERILKNFYELYKQGVPLTFKSTITPDNFTYMPEVWDDFNKIYNKLYEINPETNGRPVSYAPTIDYYNIYEDKYMHEFEGALIEIAKKEVEFYKKYKRFLTTWFDKDRTFCMAGVTMATIDINGDMYYCHGCLYKGDCDKKDFKFGSIFEDDYIDKLKYNFEEKFLKKDQVKIPECEECKTSFCVRCNVLVYGRSDKESFHEKWYDFSNQKHLCDYFNLISKILLATHRVVGGK